MAYAIWIPFVVSAFLAAFLTIYLLFPSLIIPTHLDYIDVKRVFVTYLFSYVCSLIVSLPVCGLVCFIRWIVDKIRY